MYTVPVSRSGLKWARSHRVTHLLFYNTTHPEWPEFIGGLTWSYLERYLMNELWLVFGNWRYYGLCQGGVFYTRKSYQILHQDTLHSKGSHLQIPVRTRWSILFYFHFPLIMASARRGITPVVCWPLWRNGAVSSWTTLILVLLRRRPKDRY
jgi:hypothetical protein